MNFKPTPEQEAITAAARESEDSLLIIAMAGTGKTSTLKLVSQVLPPRPSLALAFNVKIKKELEAAFPEHFDVKTMNGLGHAAWNKALGKRCEVKQDKLGDLLKAISKRENIQLSGDDWSVVLGLVRKARAMGLVPDQWRATQLLPDTEDGWQKVADACYLDPSDDQLWLARRILNECINLSYKGVLDFDDQIYMSALFGGVFTKYPIVLVDEAQDLSPLNHIQVRKSAAGRLIVVGDPRQAIYAFRGADSSSMGTLRGLREQWIDLPLSQTFRCPKAVVARQQDHAPGYNAADSAPEGEVVHSPAGTPWQAEALAPSGPTAILCRNNAPLFAAALRLIKRGIGCTLMGSEIGKALVGLSKKILPDDDADAPTCIATISSWRDSEISKARANDKEERVVLIQDKAECLLAVIENGEVKRAADIRSLLGRMFEPSSLRITLATGHKAKGLEWDNVIHLDPWRVPSKYAVSALQAGNPVPMEQDLNLRYVIETRTKRRLIFANLEEMV